MSTVCVHITSLNWLHFAVRGSKIYTVQLIALLNTTVNLGLVIRKVQTVISNVA